MIGFYKVAGCAFSVEVPDSCSLDALLPSFTAFRCDAQEEVKKAGSEALKADLEAELAEKSIFRLDASFGKGFCLPEDAVLIEDSKSDMGHTALYETAEAYVFTVRFGKSGLVHTMFAEKDFETAKASVDWKDPEAGEVLSSMLRMMFAQAVLFHNGIAVHSSTVVKDGKAWMFMGKSGTGKSTHSRLWKKAFPDCELLNDDNPVLRLESEGLVAYGSPWSGKTPCYKDALAPVGGIVRLEQAAENRFRLQEDVDSFVTILPGCSGIRTDERLNNALCDTLAQVAGMVRVGVLECLPDTEAAILCHESLHRPIQKALRGLRQYINGKTDLQSR